MDSQDNKEVSVHVKKNVPLEPTPVQSENKAPAEEVKVIPSDTPPQQQFDDEDLTVGTKEDVKAGLTEKDDGVNINTIIKEYKDAIDAGEQTVNFRNLDKVNLTIPLSDREALLDLAESIVAGVKNSTELTEQLEDYTSGYRVAREADSFYSSGNDTLKKSLEMVKADKLVETIDGVREGIAAVASKHMDSVRKGDNVVNGAEGYRIFATLTAGVRKVVLWNSGLTVTLTGVPIRLLDEFMEAASKDDYEYGKEYGAYYYIFSGLNLDRHICDKILKHAIIGSNYRGFNVGANADDSRDKVESLLAQMSLQDYQVVLWALVCLMYPMGLPVSYVCANKGCDYIHTEKADLGKLRLNNRELISDAMVKHFEKKFVTDADLLEYRKAVEEAATLHGVKNSFVLDIPGGDGYNKRYEIVLKPCSVAEHLAAGAAYNARLRETTQITDREGVYQYIAHNENLNYRPWIKEIRCTVLDENDQPVVDNPIVVENKMDGSNDETIDMILDIFQQNTSEFAKKVQEYILRSKISHIAFFFEKCPKCGTAPVNSYNGYIPYDMTQAFFILGRMKLWKLNLKQTEKTDTKSTSTDSAS